MAVRKTQQYQAVLENWGVLVRNLKAGRATGNLLREVRIKEWIDQTTELNADQLVQVVLNRIENNVKNYEVFIGMLNRVTGMDEAVRKITSAAAGAAGLQGPQTSTSGSDVPDTEATDSPDCGYTKPFELAGKPGLAILVTCDYEHTSSKRHLPATNKDAEEMETTFKQFNYDIHKLQNRDATRQGIKSMLSSASKYLNTYSTSRDLKSQVIIFAFSGHGSNKKGIELLYSDDGRQIQLEDEVIFPLVQEPSVADIPKIFFIDACRGNDVLVSVSKGGGLPREASKSAKQCWEEKGVNHVQGNYRVYYATIPDHKAYANVDGSGSRWMPVMAHALRDDEDDKSLADIASKVSSYVHNLPGDPKQQCDMLTNRITTGPLHLKRMSGGF